MDFGGEGKGVSEGYPGVEGGKMDHTHPRKAHTWDLTPSKNRTSRTWGLDKLEVTWSYLVGFTKNSLHPHPCLFLGDPRKKKITEGSNPPPENFDAPYRLAPGI